MSKEKRSSLTKSEKRQLAFIIVGATIVVLLLSLPK